MSQGYIDLPYELIYDSFADNAVGIFIARHLTIPVLMRGSKSVDPDNPGRSGYAVVPAVLRQKEGYLPREVRSFGVDVPGREVGKIDYIQR
ncbi:hypothetical protein [Yersinia pseudotuberculosis]|uniref:hypothetical protein n=1 Tax=Yersinia pseudotuberculosis TaxID=633 RepID=UPI00061C4DD8|nr:hypothetical protein [Yersinia pseudotuberculosis]CNJ76993.1 Uncharacterised protein [Yersinia pseudotuberculosis]